jgi:hypothetical protein
MTAAAPDEDCHFALILGKPGGGKGTISGKILKVGGCWRGLSFGISIYRNRNADRKARFFVPL